MIIAGALDPSATANETSDYKAWVVLAKAEGKPEIYTLDAWIRRAAPEEVIRRIWIMRQTWPAIVLGAEANGFQRLYWKLYVLLCDREKQRPMPLVPIINRSNKIDRILGCQAEFELGRCFFDPRQGDQQRLIDQFCDLPTGKHDDGPDAWEMARRLLDDAERRQRARQHGEPAMPTRHELMTAAMEPSDDWSPATDPWNHVGNPMIWTALE